MSWILLYVYAVFTVGAFLVFADRARADDSELWFVLFAAIAGAALWPLFWSYYLFKKTDHWLKDFRNE